MATTTFNIDKDSSAISEFDGDSGYDNHHPIGRWEAAAYTSRVLMQASINFAGMTGINQALLYVRYTQNHTSYGDDFAATIGVRRKTASWNENNRGENVWGGSGGWAWVTGNYVDDGDSDSLPRDTVSGNWHTIDITNTVTEWFNGATNYGIMLYNASSETNNNYSKEWGSRHLSGYVPYIWIDYATNSAPTAPTLSAPSSGSIQSDLTPQLTFTPNDPESDVHTKYHYQVDNNSDFSSPLGADDVDVSGAFPSGSPVNRNVQTTLTRGTTYYWRVKTFDGALWGPYSSSRNFVINSLPVADLSSPNNATGKLAKMVFTAESGWSSPRMQLNWTFQDNDGSHSQQKYEVDIYNDSGGSPGSSVFSSGQVSSSVKTLTPAVVYTEGAYYHVRLRVNDGLEWSAYDGFFRCRARWGLTQHRRDLAATPNSWSTTGLNATIDSTSAVVVEYNSSADTTPTLGTWKASLASVTKKRYVHYRVWYTAWGTSPHTGAKLTDLSITSSAYVANPEHWLPAPISGVGGTIEQGIYVFGNQSLTLTNDGGGAKIVRQQLKIEPNTDYILQGRVRSEGNSGAQIALSDTDTGVALLSTTALTADADFDQYVPAYWNSETRSTIWIQCRVDGAAGTVGGFDAVMIQKGRVASPWASPAIGSTPASDLAPVVLDAGGIAVNAKAGGILRLIGSAGGARDIVELGTSGLLFGGDTEVYSPVADQLAFGNGQITKLAADAYDGDEAGTSYPEGLSWMAITSTTNTGWPYTGNHQRGNVLTNHSGSPYISQIWWQRGSNTSPGDAVAVRNWKNDTTEWLPWQMIAGEIQARMLQRDAATAVPNNTWQKIGTTALGVWSTMYSNSVANTVTFVDNTNASLKVNEQGLYLITGEAEFATSTVGSRSIGIATAAGNPTHTPDTDLRVSQLPEGVGATRMKISVVRQQSSGDQLSLSCFHNHGSALNVTYARLGLTRLGA